MGFYGKLQQKLPLTVGTGVYPSRHWVRGRNTGQLTIKGHTHTPFTPTLGALRTSNQASVYVNPRRHSKTTQT